MDRFTLDEIAAEKQANEQSQSYSRSTQSRSTQSRSTQSRSTQSRSTQRGRRLQRRAGAVSRIERQSNHPSSLEPLSGQYQHSSAQQQTVKKSPIGIWQTAVGSSFLGAALVIAIWPGPFATNNTIATSHVPSRTDSVAVGSSRQALISQVLSDRQARTAYLEGDFEALNERLKDLGIADEAKEYYLQNFADEDNFKDYLNRSWDEQADYTGSARRF
ncbi:MAG: hypothetical protein WA949_03315 [Phormidesmis sp.]